jgi:hypothetical protein
MEINKEATEKVLNDFQKEFDQNFCKQKNRSGLVLFVGIFLVFVMMALAVYLYQAGITINL